MTPPFEKVRKITAEDIRNVARVLRGREAITGDVFVDIGIFADANPVTTLVFHSSPEDKCKK